MIRFLEIKTYAIDAKSFKDQAILQGWPEHTLYSIMSQLIDYHAPQPFVSDDKGKVYVSNHYRFDLLSYDLDESFFDWFTIDEMMENYN